MDCRELHAENIYIGYQGDFSEEGQQCLRKFVGLHNHLARLTSYHHLAISSGTYFSNEGKV